MLTIRKIIKSLILSSFFLPFFNIHRLQYRLPGSLILLATYTFVPQRQYVYRYASIYRFIKQIITFVSDIPFNIVEFYPYIKNSIILFYTLVLLVPITPQNCGLVFYVFSLKKKNYYWLNKPSTDPLRPIILNNACPLRITATAGT